MNRPLLAGCVVALTLALIGACACAGFAFVEAGRNGFEKFNLKLGGNMKLLLRLALPLAFCLMLAGCKDPYGGCAKAGADIAQGVSAGLATVTSLEQQGEITPSEALNVGNYLEFANKADEAFLTCVSVAHTSGNKPGTYTACVSTFSTTLNTPAELALVKVSNTTASTTINTIVTGFTTATALIQSQLGGA